jgi:hypothetical protein
MNSSRSIAAARNKRANEVRPNTSIGSSIVFSQQSNGQNQPQRPGQQSQLRPRVQEQPTMKPKISVGDAIGLTTIRLCKVENFIKELKDTGTVGLPPNTQVVDNSLLTNMINRLDALEKKEIATNEKIKQLEQVVLDLTRETGEKFADFDSALIEIEKLLPQEQDDIEYDVTQSGEISDMITADLKTLVEASTVA